MRARVVRDYRTQYANPIRFARGDVVALGARDTEWPAFAWTTTADAVALRDYSAQELDARAGDTVALGHELGHWWWCTHADGRSGWLPARDLQPINETTSEETSE
jgi:hypothetical protein